MRDIIHMTHSGDGAMPLGFIERSIELARIQANEHGLDRVHLWVATGDDVISIAWSADNSPPADRSSRLCMHLGVFTVEPLPPDQKLVAQSGATV